MGAWDPLNVQPKYPMTNPDTFTVGGDISGEYVLIRPEGLIHGRPGYRIPPERAREYASWLNQYADLVEQRRTERKDTVLERLQKKLDEFSAIIEELGK
jgi:hypothetical protein